MATIDACCMRCGDIICKDEESNAIALPPVCLANPQCVGMAYDLGLDAGPWDLNDEGDDDDTEE
jgi:hypothetical protein